MAALEIRNWIHLHFLHLNRYSATVTLAGLLKPAVQSVHPIPAAARKYADLRPLFSVMALKLRQIELLQREVKVASALLLIVTMNQTIIFLLSRSSFRLLRIGRSQPEPSAPFSIWNSQLLSGLECKSTEQNQDWVNVRATVQVGEPAVLYSKKRSANYGVHADQPMILDDDESDEAGTGDKAEGTSGDVDTERIGWDASPHNTLATAEVASGPTKSIDVSGPWNDVEEGRYVDEPAPRLGSYPPPILSATTRSDQPARCQSITQSMSVEPVPHSLAKRSNNGDDGWTDDTMAELEKEVELALVEQVNSSTASALSSPRPRSVEEPQGEIKCRERTETTGSKPEELRDASRHGTPAQSLEDWDQRETQVVVETLGRSEPREGELVAEGGG
ncbi:uncharacterized protein PAC_06238 [Phialocephala subalpina]|uniref:Uncharacterized protein n=1 Tax=Phialocephala subalpina TaxID=576137 RepID=A0A1L7WUC2_9HELO|nr:uncharacterized protein PAC_06238 [Phialocephala subalpina]